MAYKQKTGTLMIQRTYPTVGRIQRASGTTDEKVHARIVAVLDTLYQQGRLDVLANVKSGIAKPMEVFSLWNSGQLASVGNVRTVQPLTDAVAAWLKDLDRTEKTVRGYRDQFKYMMSHGPATARVRDLPTLLERYRAHCKKEGKNRSFELARSAVLSFVRRAVKDPELWAKCSLTEGLSRKRRTKPNPLTVEQVRTLCGQLPPKAAKAFLSMCLSGMRVYEYFGLSGATWQVEGRLIQINGTKTASSVRKAPLIYQITEPSLHYKTLEIALRKASGGTVTMRNARQTYLYWLRKAGVDRVDRLIYTGHSEADVHDLYEWHSMTEHMEEDAERVRKWIAEQDWPTKGMRAERFQEFNPETGEFESFTFFVPDPARKSLPSGDVPLFTD
jgi:integrase